MAERYFARRGRTLTMTPGIPARLSARLLREFGSPDGILHASLTHPESCNLPAPVAQPIFKKQNFWRAEKELDAAGRVGCKLVNWTEPEYPHANLRSTGGALRARRCQHPGHSNPGHCGHAPPGLWDVVA
jgi:predicted Rossmann fold nucleotide-binding protein DprA/Smf involved in DNA uptake